MKIHETLAGTLKATHLFCRVCGMRIVMSKADAARYFAAGWPICHGTTMSLDPGCAEPARSDSTLAPKTPSKSP